MRNQSQRQQGRKDELKRPEWLKEYSENKDLGTISLRHDQIRSYDKEYNHHSLNLFKNDNQPLKFN